MKPKIIVGMYGIFALLGKPREFLESLAEHGASGLRVFGHFAWGIQGKLWTPFARILDIRRINDFQFNPPLPGEQDRRERYIVGPDGGVWFSHRKYSPPIVPVHDLDKFDPAYFEAVEEFFTICKELNLSVEPFELDDNCSDKGEGILKYWSPYLSSPQAHSSATPGGLFGASIKMYMRAYWKRVIELAMRVGVDARWSIRNEYDYRDPDKPASLAWYRDSVISASLIMADNPMRSRAFIGSAMNYHKEILDICGAYSIHGIGHEDAFKFNCGLMEASRLNVSANKHRLYLSGDGFSDGTGSPDFRGRRGIGLKEVPWLADKTKEGFAGYEMLIRYYGGHARGSLDDFQEKYQGLDILHEFAKRFDTLPPPPPKPEPPPEPEYADLFVCAKTMLIPNKNCKDVVIKRFWVGFGPKEICSKCKRPCSYYLKRLNFKRWWRCIWG